MPTPPVTVNAPVVVLVEFVVLVTANVATFKSPAAPLNINCPPKTRLPPIPTPPTTVNAPVVVLVDCELDVTDSVLRDKFVPEPWNINLPPSTRSCAIPTPPLTTSPPVVVDVEFVLVVNSTCPFARKLLTTNSSASPLNINWPPRTRLPPMPTPPAICTAPVVVLVDCDVDVTNN